MRDADGNLIKTEIPREAPSVCIEDFCGYVTPGHFAVSFAADYFPTLGFVRFTGDWWNVPDMPVANEPTELKVNQWARAHGANFTYVPDEARAYSTHGTEGRSGRGELMTYER